jgi:hypothetical protein
LSLHYTPEIKENRKKEGFDHPQQPKPSLKKVRTGMVPCTPVLVPCAQGTTGTRIKFRCVYPCATALVSHIPAPVKGATTTCQDK